MGSIINFMLGFVFGGMTGILAMCIIITGGSNDR